RSSTSSTLSAPSWVTAWENSARVTSSPSATGSSGRSSTLAATTAADSSPKRSTSAAGRYPAGEVLVSGCPGAPIRGRSAVWHDPAASPVRSTTRSTACSAMSRYSVSLPPVAVMRPSSGVAVGGVDEAALSGEGAEDVGAGQGGLPCAPDHVEEEVDLLLGGVRDIRHRAGGIHVGQAHVDPAGLGGQAEAEAVGLSRDGD